MKSASRLKSRHFPPGTSKWNKIEHRVFCHITSNWRGQPLETHQIVVDLIGSTRTKTGLVVKAKLDAKTYHKGRKVTQAEMQSVNITSQPISRPNGTTLSALIRNDYSKRLFVRGTLAPSRDLRAPRSWRSVSTGDRGGRGQKKAMAESCPTRRSSMPAQTGTSGDSGRESFGFRF